MTESEQYLMSSIRNADIAKKQHAEYMKAKRREEGAGSMTEYNAERKNKRLERLSQLENLMTLYPDKTQAEYAKMMDTSKMTVSRLMKQLKGWFEGVAECFLMFYNWCVSMNT